jgi:hypothetical protein
MSVTADEIQDLLKSQMYNPEILPKLEAYLHSQVQSGSAEPNPYSIQANRTLVKLYQFFPARAKAENLILAELLALVYSATTSEGSVDFGALGCLISESVKKEEPFPTLARCTDLLDSCQFPEFWKTFGSIESTHKKVSELAKSSHAKHALRRSILNTLSQSFRSTGVSYVLAQLDFNSAKELENFVKENGSNNVVESILGDIVTFTAKIENTKREKVYQDTRTDYGSIRRLMNKKVVASE